MAEDERSIHPSAMAVCGTFLEYVAWLRRGDDPRKLDPFNTPQMFGHLDIDYSNLHIVAALLTNAHMIHEGNNPDEGYYRLPEELA